MGKTSSLLAGINHSKKIIALTQGQRRAPGCPELRPRWLSRFSRPDTPGTRPQNRMWMRLRIPVTTMTCTSQLLLRSPTTSESVACRSLREVTAAQVRRRNTPQANLAHTTSLHPCCQGVPLLGRSAADRRDAARNKGHSMYDFILW